MAETETTTTEPTPPSEQQIPVAVSNEEEEKTLLFGTPAVTIPADRIRPNVDVLIHDRAYLTPTAMSSSFYHELIRNCQDKLRPGADAVPPATRMVDLVHNKRQGSFVWCRRQEEEEEYFALSREQAIAKLSTDLRLRLLGQDAVVGSALLEPKKKKKDPPSVNKKDPPAVNKKDPPEKKDPPVDPQRQYALKCMATVLNSTALALDVPLRKNETERQRKLRLLLRHRFLAATRSGMPYKEFVSNLLRGWHMSWSELNHHIHSSHNGGKRKKDNSSSSSDTKKPKRSHPSDDSPDENCNLGSWTDDEKTLYVAALEQHGWGKWREITALIPTRCQRQVTSYSRYLCNKVPEVKHKGLPLPQAFLDQVFSQKGRRPTGGPDRVVTKDGEEDEAVVEAEETL